MNIYIEPSLKEKKLLAVYLRNLGERRSKPKHPGFGICLNVEVALNLKNRKYVEYLLPIWPKYSGDYTYPIPISKYSKYKNANQAYQYSSNLWDPRTKYGRNRLEACLFLARYIEDNIKTYTKNSIEESTNNV